MKQKKRQKKAFYSQQTEQSRVKAQILSKYFSAWAKVVGGATRGERIGYVDLFAGRGEYRDGMRSTPLLILERAIADADVSQMLVTVFNDLDYAADLKAALAAVPGIHVLKHSPTVRSMDVGKPSTVKLFEKDLIPTLAFLDPWGYRGLSRELFQALLKNWGCDLVFFLNFNQINRFLSASRVERHMEALFGPALLAELRAKVRRLHSGQRERAIMRALKDMLLEIGGEYVLPFRFRRVDGRTSHYLVFVSKAFRGCHIMRNVMAAESSHEDADEVPSFECDPRLASQPTLAVREGGRLQRLKDRILEDAAGRTFTVESLYEWHSRDRLFVFKNYQEALRQLESERRVKIDPPASKRRPYGGKISMPRWARVKIPAH